MFLWIFTCSAQSPTPMLVGGPQENYQNVVRIVNNTNPALTASSPSVGTYGTFMRSLYVTSGPCIPAGAIRSMPAIASGGDGVHLYKTGDIVAIDGGTQAVKFSVIANGGIVTSLNPSPVISPLLEPYGSGYSPGKNIFTTTIKGAGSGLAVNIASVFTSSKGPNCAWISDWPETASWATGNTFLTSCTDASCSNGQSFTLNPFAPAPSALAITGNVDFQGRYPYYRFTVDTPGSEQTSGTYLSGMPQLSISGGGGKDARIAVQVTSSGTVKDDPRYISFGTEYKSCPIITLSAGGTPATFKCTQLSIPVWTFDTSLSAGTYYYDQITGSLNIGTTQDRSGNIWSIFPEGYPTVSSGNGWNGQFVNAIVSYAAIHKSNDGGITWQPEKELLFDSTSSPHCGPNGNTLPCSYVVAGLTTTQKGALLADYWISDPGVVIFGNFTPAVGGRCCFITRCNPKSDDCSSYKNWKMYQIKGNSPSGNPWSYTLESQTFSNGNIAVGLIDSMNKVYIAISCDDGKSFNTGRHCAKKLTTLFALSDPTTPGMDPLPTFEFWINCYTSCRSATNATYMAIARNNIGIYASGARSCVFGQVTCGPPIFGYSTNSGKTWHFAQSSLSPFTPMTKGEYGIAGPYLMDTKIKAPNGNDYWTFSWIERDQTPSANIYLITSTVDPGNLIADLSSWKNNSLVPLWYYKLGPQPSTVSMTMTGRGRATWWWNANPGTSSGGWGFWWSHGEFKFKPGGMQSRQISP